MLTHYSDFRVKSLDDQSFLIGKLIHAVHSFIKYEIPGAENGQSRVAIDLPEMPLATDNIEGDHPTPGTSLRVFSDEHLLAKLRNYPPVTVLLSSGAVVMRPARVVPSEASFVQVRRYRQAEKETDRYRLRVEARRESRGATSVNIKRNKSHFGVKQRVFIRSSSSTTSKRFSLFLVAQKCDGAGDQLFNSYGLSRGGGVLRF